jgi:hypothetical protein
VYLRSHWAELEQGKQAKAKVRKEKAAEEVRLSPS